MTASGGGGASDGAVPHAHDARVVLYSRTGCHMCEQARAVVAATCADVGVDWAEIDVDAPEHPQLRERFSEEVPVTYVDGRQHDFWRVDAQRLRRALAAG
jgi:glutaredoxin